MQYLKEQAYNLLRRSERIFKTDMVYIAKNGGWLTFGQIASAVLSLASALVFANFISKDIYGNYKYIISITSILGALSLTGMGPVVVQGVAQGKEGVFMEAVRTSLRWGWIMVVGAVFISVYYFLNHNTSLSISMLVAGVAMLFISSYSLYGNYLSGKKNFKDLTIYNVLSQIIIFIITIVVIIATKNVLYMVIAYFVTNVIVTLFFYKRVVDENHINDTKDHSLMTYSKHLSFLGFFGAAASQLDKVLIFHYLGAVNLAVYSFSMAIPEQFRGVYKNLFAVVAPKYATLDEQDLRHSVGKKFMNLTLLTAIFVVIYIIAAPYIFAILFPKYIEAVLYSQIFMLGMITIPGIGLFANYFQVRKATATVYKISIINNVAIFIVTFIFIRTYGLMGAVIANGVSWLIMALVLWYYFMIDKIETYEV
jgi:O-antigen/teichoic acid export membrane protein